MFVVSLDDELNISESRVLASTDKIVSLRYYKDRLFLVLSRRVYKFDDDLNTLHREDLEEKVIAACFSGINRLALFAADEGYIYNTYTFVREYVFSYPSADAIRVRDDAVALSTPVGDFCWTSPACDISSRQRFIARTPITGAKRILCSVPLAC